MMMKIMQWSLTPKTEASFRATRLHMPRKRAPIGITRAAFATVSELSKDLK